MSPVPKRGVIRRVNPLTGDIEFYPGESIPLFPEPKPKVPKRVVEVGADEAAEILAEQDRVVGYSSFEQADEIRKELKRKHGVSAKVVADVGPVQHARSAWEARVLESLDLRPGERYTRYGLVRVRGHRRRR